MANRVSNVTWDHERIRRWAEARGGVPAAVKGTARGGRDTGIIRIDFPGYSGAGRLSRISWDEFFEKFDDSNLALVYEERTARGVRSNFNKLVRRDTVEGRGSTTRRSTKLGRALAGMVAVGLGRAARARRSPGGRKTSRTSRTRRATKARTPRMGGRRTVRSGARRAGAATSARTSRAGTGSRRKTTARKSVSRGGRRTRTRSTRSR